MIDLLSRIIVLVVSFFVIIMGAPRKRISQILVNDSIEFLVCLIDSLGLSITELEKNILLVYVY